MRDRLILLRDLLIAEMHDLEVIIYNRLLPYDEQIEKWEDVDEETIQKLLDIDQNSKEVYKIDEFSGHNWDCGAWWAHKEAVTGIENILNGNEPRLRTIE